ncbi:MAG: sugar transferase [Candidatus Latescibacteria bacterium]|nr:sugar transferase [bacterium]MCB9515075.1 sugar transferase [Candidatus Latescibacterota bacterium]
MGSAGATPFAQDGDLVAFPVRDPWYYRASKRLMDILFSGVGILLFLPLMVPLAIIIKLESDGPIFFRQIRVGKGRRHFVCYKFRSMVADAESLKEEISYLNEAEGPMFKIRDDPRITPLGRFLRRSSLDELPQLFNVLKGDMSIVGPRPQIPSEVELYEPWHYRRLEVQPGITCLWQVSGRSSIGFDEWMRLDMEYVKLRSLVFDVKLLLRTLPAIIARRGAY